MPSNGDWPRTRLKYAADCNLSVLPERTDESFEFEYVDVGDVSQGKIELTGKNMTFADAPSRARRLAEPGDTVLSTVRTYLRAIARVPEASSRLVFSTGLAVLHPRESFEPRWLAYFLQSQGFVDEVVSRSVGVGYPAISPHALTSLSVPKPPVEEQHAIADYLDRETARIDTLIEKQEKLIETLVERRLATVEHAIRGYKRMVPLRALTTLIQTGPFGSQLKSDEYTPGGIPIVNPSQIVDSEIVAAPNTAVPSEKAAELSRHRLRTNDVVAGRRGELGRCAVVGAAEDGFLCGTGSILVRPNQKKIGAPFLRLAFASRRSRDSLSLASVGSTMENLNTSIVGSLKVPVPPLGEQEACIAQLQEHTDRIDELISKTREFIKLTKERRAALITAAVTGQIDVGEEAVGG